MYLEPEVEPIFHPDSYGYRPGRSALDAVGVCRERCWRSDWVIDLDIRAFFDNLDHDLVLKAVAHHTDQRWVLLYVQRWLTAPLQRQDGTLVARDRGTPQGSAISPLLANLFMHYAFDAWMAREFPDVRFERYCDDVVVHCRSEAQAHQVREAIADRLAECGLELHPDKTRIVYCKDADRTWLLMSTRRSRSWATRFGPGWPRTGTGKYFVQLPAGGQHGRDEGDGPGDPFAGSWTGAVTSPWTTLPGCSTASCRAGSTTTGASTSSMLYPLPPPHQRRSGAVGHAGNTNGSRADERRAMAWLAEHRPAIPQLFAHWRLGARPDGWAMGAG